MTAKKHVFIGTIMVSVETDNWLRRTLQQVRAELPERARKRFTRARLIETIVDHYAEVDEAVVKRKAVEKLTDK